jgi:glycosyltransferase involved in cell wall biosynthesis
VSSTLSLPANADSRAERLALPQSYVLAIGGLAGRRGLSSVLAALSRAETNEVPLVVVGTAEGEAILAAAAEAGLDASRIHVLGELSDADLSVVYDRAAALVQPSQLEGFGFPLLEAMHFGTPVIHSDTPALVELAGSAGLEIALDDPEELPERIAAAIATVLTDDAERDRLRQAGIDRAGLYSWESSAEKIWQLHADL